MRTNPISFTGTAASTPGEGEQSFDMTLSTILRSSPSQTLVSTTFKELESYIPQLDSAEIIQLEKMLSRLFGFFPHLFSIERANLTSQLGTWYLHNGDPVKAMKYYAYALKQETSEKNHMLVSKVFLQWVLKNDIYKERLEQAYREGNVDLFNQLLDSILEMKQFFYHEQDFYSLRKIANAILIEDPRENRMDQFAECADKLHSLTPPALAIVPVTKKYYQALQTYRQYCTLEHYKSYFQTLLYDAFALLGRPPCQFDIRAMGSLARNEPGPFSDLEYFILIEHAKQRTYFQQLAQLIELQFLSLGETDFPILPLTKGFMSTPEQIQPDISI